MRTTPDAAEWRFDHAAVDDERTLSSALRTSRPKSLPMGRTTILLRKLMPHTMVAVSRALPAIPESRVLPVARCLVEQ